jgi:chromosome segregation ATPase
MQLVHQAEISSMSKLYADEVSALQLRETELTTQVGQLTGELQEARQAAGASKQAQEELEKSKATAESHNRELACLKLECQEHSQREEQLTAQLAESTGRLFTAEQALTLSKESQVELERQVAATSSDAQSKTEEAEKEIIALRQQVEATSSDAQSKVEEAEKEIVALRRQVEATSLDAQSRAEEAEKEIVALRRQVEATTSDAQSKAEEAEKEIVALRRQVEATTSDAQSKAEEAEKEIAGLRRQVEDLGRQLADVTAASIAERENSQSHEEELKSVTMDCQAQQAQVREMTAVINARDAEIQMLKKSQETLRSENERLRDEYAVIAGHANHQQKIKLHLKLKEENNALREEVAKCQEQYLQALEKISL